MSGGSFDYMYFNISDPGDFWSRHRVAEEMADGMEADGGGDVAVALRLALFKMQSLVSWLAVVESDLADVLRAYEWWKSGDSSRQGFEEALEKWRSCRLERG